MTLEFYSTIQMKFTIAGSWSRLYNGASGQNKFGISILSWGGNPKKENLLLKLFIITGQPKAQNLKLLSGIEQDSI